MVSDPDAVETLAKIAAARDELEELAEREEVRTMAGRRAPVETLAKIAETRRKLDALERVAVREAVAAGASWETIATALGVRRQSAWRRLHRVAYDLD